MKTLEEIQFLVCKSFDTECIIDKACDHVSNVAGNEIKLIYIETRSTTLFAFDNIYQFGLINEEHIDKINAILKECFPYPFKKVSRYTTKFILSDTEKLEYQMTYFS